jgi:protein-tyrosine phosphatase
MQRTSDQSLLDDPLSWIAATPEFTFDAVIPGLYQGDFPTGTVDWSHFDDVVSLTVEDVPGVRLQVGGLRMHVPIWDDEMVDPTGVRAAALAVAERVTAGKRVLVHCSAGLNRSGVVSARALMFMGMPVAEAIARVRSARGPDALSNREFVAWLHEEEEAYDSGDAAERFERPRQLLGAA